MFGWKLIRRQTWDAIISTQNDLQRQINALARNTFRHDTLIRKLTPPGGIPVGVGLAPTSWRWNSAESALPPDLPTVALTAPIPLAIRRTPLPPAPALPEDWGIDASDTAELPRWRP